MNVGRCVSLAILASMVMLAWGCAAKMPPSPLIYRGQQSTSPWEGIPATWREPDMDVLYATDRQPVVTEGVTHYGSQRSPSLAFGRAVVKFAEQVDWDHVERASVDSQGSQKLSLAMGTVQELGRFPRTDEPPEASEGKLHESQAVQVQEKAARDALHQELRRRLAESPRKEVVIYVHGYANGFEKSAFRAAQLWHYLGRQFVPIVYSWPAGSGMEPLRGYAHERESGEFTVYHLRQFLLALSECPEITRIHFIAHSRGTDVLMTTLRELKLSLGNNPLSARQSLRLGTVVLAAPDLDWDVTKQRISADRVTFVPERLVCYISPHDKAIALSDWLFSSQTRFGKLSSRDLSQSQQTALNHFNHVELVRVTRQTSFLGHSYFTDDPAVLSDLILLLRDGKLPGPDHGRPLQRQTNGIWDLDDEYLSAYKP